MICPLHKARGWVRCPAWADDEGQSDRQCAMPGNADLLDCQGQPQPPPLRSGKHTTIAQQESGRILSSIWRQVVGAIPTGGSKSGDPPPSNGERKMNKSKAFKGLPFARGYQEMVRRLKPETIIFYGTVPDECRENIVRIRAFQEKFREAKCDGW